MITISIVSEDDTREAFQWHRGFSAENEFIFPRTRSEYEDMIKRGNVWCARNADGNFLGMAYHVFETPRWEIGGLMIAREARNSNLGLILAYVVLGNLLHMENPLAWGHIIVINVHIHNTRVGRAIARFLAFTYATNITISGTRLPGMATRDDGMIEGQEFKLNCPKTLLVLAAWCDKWNDTLSNGKTVQIELPIGTSLSGWASSFRQMADNCNEYNTMPAVT